MEIFGVSLPGLLSQLLLGLVNGSFYAILSLGLAVIFGLLNVINFAHGALFMTGRPDHLDGHELFGHQLLVDAGAGAAGGGLVRGVDRAAAAALDLQARPPVRPAAHAGSHLADRGRVPLDLRCVWPGLRHARAAGRRHQPRLHDLAQLPGLGGCRVRRGVLGHLVCDRENKARRLLARRHREPSPGRGLRHQRAASWSR